MDVVMAQQHTMKYSVGKMREKKKPLRKCKYQLGIIFY